MAYHRFSLRFHRVFLVFFIVFGCFCLVFASLLLTFEATDPEMQFEVSVAKPLKDGAEQLNQKVDSFLQRIASVVEAGDEEKGIKALRPGSEACS